MRRSWNGWARVAAVGTAGALLVSGCSGKALEADDNKGTTAGQPVTLTINFWGDMGLDKLKAEYEAANPNVKLALNSGEFQAQHEDLQKKLVAGTGVPDISAVDESRIVQFRSQADKFVNLLDKGAAEYEAKYLPWKWQLSLSADKKTQIGLGTDVGGLAMCYRTDLFKAAGLPVDREEVSKLWPSWDKFIETGQTYTAKTKKKFVDSGVTMFSPILGQQQQGLYDTSEKLQMEGGPKVAFDITMKAIQAGLSANLASFQPNWDRGFTTGQFAVLACPAWMQGHIRKTAPSTEGKWDIAAIPGGGGNWGGSYWTVPKDGKNVDEAVKLIKWLVAPEQQIKVFKEVGNLPSQTALLKDPAILDFKAPFFSNAPVGQIFAKTAEGLVPQYQGRRSGQTRVAIENVINTVQQGKLAPDKAWPEAVKAAEKVATS